MAGLNFNPEFKKNSAFNGALLPPPLMPSCTGVHLVTHPQPTRGGPRLPGVGWRSWRVFIVYEAGLGLGGQPSAPGQGLKQQSAQPLIITDRAKGSERPRRGKTGDRKRSLFLPLTSHPPDSSQERGRDHSIRSQFESISRLCPTSDGQTPVTRHVIRIIRTVLPDEVSR